MADTDDITVGGAEDYNDERAHLDALAEASAASVATVRFAFCKKNQEMCASH